MDQEPNKPQPEKKGATQTSFESILFTDQSPSYESPPDEITMIPLLTNVTIDLKRRTVQDSGKTEFLYRFTLEADNKIAVRPSLGDPVRGSHTEVSSLRPQSAGRFSHRPLIYLGTAHSHGNTSPPPFSDISVLLKRDDRFAIVTTENRSYLFLKTKDTKQAENSEIWETEQYRHFADRIAKGENKHGETDTERVDRTIWEQTLLLCQRHKLLVYTSDNSVDYQLFS